MSDPHLTPPLREAIRQVIGYMNFSSGQPDLVTLQNLNTLHATAAAGQPLSGPPPWLVVQHWITEELNNNVDAEGAFANVDQARRCLQLTCSKLLPAYLDFHRDLLFHQVPELLFNGFFVGRCIEAILAEMSTDRPDDQTITAAITRLNNFVGFRPVAQLENRRCEPYPHEWVAPLPIYIKGVGVADGPYQRLIHQTIEILRDTDYEIQSAAHFDIDRVTELAIDPRAYDFEHPVNRRPNYHFGQWDPHAINSEGYYHRFIIQQVTLDALISRLEDEPDLPRNELYTEAATVLAGTVLMATGISGWGPAAHDSEVTLASLMAPIVTYRDAFYEDRLRKTAGPHAQRLQDEQTVRQQPFGAVRQHLNATLASQRAGQQQHAHLARLYAKMGYADASKRQADTLDVASARVMCRIDCAVIEGMRALKEGDLQGAARVPKRVIDLVNRGIECGALVDPWNILGFAGNFSLFQGLSSSIHDHRVDDLIALIDRLFGFMAKCWSEAAAQNNTALCTQLDNDYNEVVQWWRQFAAHTVDALQAVDALESYESAKLVARALQLWHSGGAAAGDIKFWAPHAELFSSPRAYALVIDALLERNDFVASMALLIHWLSNAEDVGMRRGATSWSLLAEKWLIRLRNESFSTLEAFAVSAEPSPKTPRQGPRVERPWSLIRRFFDLLEPNTETYWRPPQFHIGGKRSETRDWDQELADAERGASLDDPEGIYDAAYDEVTYRDSTDDGFDGAIFDFGEDEDKQDELEVESRRLGNHLDFHVGLARLWVLAADLGKVAEFEAKSFEDSKLLETRANTLTEWASQAAVNRVGLLALLDSVLHYQVQPSGTDTDSMRSYDRRRVVRDALLERIIATAVEMSDARRLLTGVLLAETTDSSMAEVTGVDADAGPSEPGSVAAELAGTMGEEDRCAVRMFAALVRVDSDLIRQQFPQFLQAIQAKSLLYIPLSRGGDPVQIFIARLRQRVMTHLLCWLPRQGLFIETCRLIEAARIMEQQNPVGPGAVTEFDGLFRIGFRSMVQAIANAAKHWPQEPTADRSENLIPILESLTETLLASWLTHSQSLRLSTLEMVADEGRWNTLVDFIKRYGDSIFTQTFLQLGNVRAILHQGVGAWLERLSEHPGDLEGTKLIQALGGPLKLDEAQRHLATVFEAILDHHVEFLDYSSTTTQSDRGEMLYMFLDFLRLRVRYDRIAWNLKPVMWAHEILIRSGFNQEAGVWQRSLSDRSNAESESFIEKLRAIQKRYSMRMPSIADRIAERFVQPMTIDRVRALVEPSIQDAEQGDDCTTFNLLEKEANVLADSPSGSGVDLPTWLNALEEEIDAALTQREGIERSSESPLTVSEANVSREEIEAQLKSAQRQGRRLPYMR